MISILPIVNFPFINTNIPAVLAYIYIHISCGSDQYFLDRGLLPTTAQKTVRMPQISTKTEVRSGTCVKSNSQCHFRK